MAAARITAGRAWGWDWTWPYYGLFTNPATGQPYPTEGSFVLANVARGGGGFSAGEAAPGYQRSVRGAASYSALPYLSASGAFTAAPAAVTGTGSGREVPDLVTDADPYTGYEEYFSGFSGARLESGWGGTSVAPQLAGAAAVIDSYLGRRSGFWNPEMYRLAGHPGSPFTPLDTTGPGNDNLYYTGTAGHVYNVGTGLGTPNLDKLAQAFRRIRR